MDGAILVVSAPDGPMPQDARARVAGAAGGSAGDRGLPEQSGHDGRRGCWSWWSWSCASCCASSNFPGTIARCRGSALQALESTSTDPNAPEYASIWELLGVDEYIPTPKREMDKAVPDAD